MIRPSKWVIAAAVVALGAAGCSGAGSSSGVARFTTSTSSGSGRASSKSAGTLKVALAPWKLAAPIANEVLVADGSQVTVLGGLDATKLSTKAIVHVDPTTGASTSAGELAEAVHDSAGVRLARNILVLGGGGPSENGTADAQLVTAEGHASTIGKMPQPRSDHVAAAVDGKIYVLGGYDGANIVGDVLATTDGVVYTKVAALPVPVRYPALAVLGKAIYLFGGVASTNGTDTAAIQRLDTTTGRIEIVGRLPTTLSHASSVVLGHQAYLLGGYVNSVKLSDQILRFDAATGTAAPAGRLPEPNSDAAAIVVNRVGYLVGGKSTARNPLTTVLALKIP